MIPFVESCEEDGTEVDRPDAVAGFFESDVMLLQRVGDEEQPILEAKGARVRHALHAGGSRGGDLGYTTGTYEDSLVGPDGKRMTEKGKYVCIWAKQADGSWKAIHDTWNSDSK